MSTPFVSQASLHFYKDNDVKLSLDLGLLSGRLDCLDFEINEKFQVVGSHFKQRYMAEKEKNSDMSPFEELDSVKLVYTLEVNYQDKDDADRDFETLCNIVMCEETIGEMSLDKFMKLSPALRFEHFMFSTTSYNGKVLQIFAEVCDKEDKVIYLLPDLIVEPLNFGTNRVKRGTLAAVRERIMPQLQQAFNLYSEVKHDADHVKVRALHSYKTFKTSASMFNYVAKTPTLADYYYEHDFPVEIKSGEKVIVLEDGE